MSILVVDHTPTQRQTLKQILATIPSGTPNRQKIARTKQIELDRQARLEEACQIRDAMARGHVTHYTFWSSVAKTHIVGFAFVQGRRILQRSTVKDTDLVPGMIKTTKTLSELPMHMEAALREAGEL